MDKFKHRAGREIEAMERGYFVLIVLIVLTMAPALIMAVIT